MVGLGVESSVAGTGHYSAAGPVYGLAGNRHGGGPPDGCRDASRPGPPGERRARTAATAVAMAPTAQHPATR